MPLLATCCTKNCFRSVFGERNKDAPQPLCFQHYMTSFGFNGCGVLLRQQIAFRRFRAELTDEMDIVVPQAALPSSDRGVTAYFEADHLSPPRAWLRRSWAGTQFFEIGSLNQRSRHAFRDVPRATFDAHSEGE